MVVPYKLDPWAVLYVNAMHQFVFAVPYIDLFGSWEDCARTWRHMRVSWPTMWMPIRHEMPMHAQQRGACGLPCKAGAPGAPAGMPAYCVLPLRMHALCSRPLRPVHMCALLLPPCRSAWLQ